MTTSPTLPFTATTSLRGDVVIYYVGTEPRMSPDQAVAFADQLYALAGRNSA
ncbi:hypothetical protein [Streptosporangium roseum]|uniref:hypothetical protein n=1 Tax=Streptosporangium roseum TaxID=2001 RepID=UPI00331A2709